jgi:hypothetical protein
MRKMPKIKITARMNRLNKVKGTKLKGVKVMELKVDKYSKFGELGDVLRMTNQAVQKSGLSREELLEIEAEARRNYGKSRGRY